MRELTEFSQIVDGEWPETPAGAKAPTQEDLTRALQVMLTRQVIYASTPSLGGSYEIARTYSSFFERYFAALGYRFVSSVRDQMVALSVPQGEARYDSVYERLRKDETLVLLTLRLLWEEAVANQEIGDGGIFETTTGDLVDRLKAVTQQDPPDEGRLLDILRFYQRRGAVRMGQRDRSERVTPLFVLPGISILVPDTFVDDLKLWAVYPETAASSMRDETD